MAVNYNCEFVTYFSCRGSDSTERRRFVGMTGIMVWDIMVWDLWVSYGSYHSYHYPVLNRVLKLSGLELGTAGRRSDNKYRYPQS